MPSRYLNGYQKKIIRHVLKAQLKAKREGLFTTGDKFWWGYSEMLKRAQRTRAIEKRTFDSFDRIIRESERDFALGYAAALHDLNEVYHGTLKEQRVLALKLDWYETSQKRRKARAERLAAQEALIKELTEL